MHVQRSGGHTHTNKGQPLTPEGCRLKPGRRARVYTRKKHTPHGHTLCAEYGRQPRQGTCPRPPRPRAPTRSSRSAIPLNACIARACSVRRLGKLDEMCDADGRVPLQLDSIIG